MSTDEQPTRARAKRLGLPVAERLLKRFSDAALAAQMSTQRATNEALKAWMASRYLGRCWYSGNTPHTVAGVEQWWRRRESNPNHVIFLS